MYIFKLFSYNYQVRNMFHRVKCDRHVINVPGKCLLIGLETFRDEKGQINYRGLKDYFRKQSTGLEDSLTEFAGQPGYVDVDAMEKKKSKKLITTHHYEKNLGPVTRQFI